MKQQIIEEDYNSLMDSDCDEYRRVSFTANLEVVQLDMHYSTDKQIATVCVFDEALGADLGFMFGHRYDSIEEAMKDYRAEFEKRTANVHLFDF